MNTKTKAQRINKRQDAIWDKAKRAQAETAAAAPEAPRDKHGRLIEGDEPEYRRLVQESKYPADKTAHTPGPWYIGCGKAYRPKPKITQPFICHGDENTVAPILAEINYCGNESQMQANARLIAAAPELLAALKNAGTAISQALNMETPELPYSQVLCLSKALTKSEAAIAAAEGSAQ